MSVYLFLLFVFEWFFFLRNFINEVVLQHFTFGWIKMLNSFCCLFTKPALIQREVWSFCNIENFSFQKVKWKPHKGFCRIVILCIATLSVTLKTNDRCRLYERFKWFKCVATLRSLLFLNVDFTTFISCNSINLWYNIFVFFGCH